MIPEVEIELDNRIRTELKNETGDFGLIQAYILGGLRASSGEGQVCLGKPLIHHPYSFSVPYQSGYFYLLDHHNIPLVLDQNSKGDSNPDVINNHHFPIRNCPLKSNTLTYHPHLCR